MICLFKSVEEHIRVGKNNIEKRHFRFRYSSPRSGQDVTILLDVVITSRGIPQKDYTYFRDGIFRIRNHILGGKFNGEIAGAYASRILYLASALFTRQKNIVKIQDTSAYLSQELEIVRPKRFSYLRIVDPVSYAYLVEAVRLLQGTELVR